MPSVAKTKIIQIKFKLATDKLRQRMGSKKDIKHSKMCLPEESVKSDSALFFSTTECKNATQRTCGKPTTAAHQLTNDKDYDEYLKNGSREMVKQWHNTIEKIRQRKMVALKKKEEQKKAEG